MIRPNIPPSGIRLRTIIGLLCMVYQWTNAQNAPITLAPVQQADSGNYVSIPISVTNFNNIGAVSLTIEFDNSVLNYISAASGGGFPGLTFGNAIPGSVTIAGFSTLSSGISLTDGTVLFTLTFMYNGGSSNLSWYDNGTSCEYAGSSPSYNTLNDIPQSTYYIDGSVSGFPLPGDAGTITGPANGMVCDGATGEVFVIEPIPDATGYVWNLPEGAVITAGENTPEITVTFTPGMADGFIEVYGTNRNGQGLPSPAFPVIINLPPAIVVQPVSPEPVFEGEGEAFFAVMAGGSELTYQWQEYNTTWNNITDGDIYSGTLTDSLLITNPPYSLNNTRYRCLISGFCEPQAVTDGNATLTVTQFPLPGAAGSITGPDEGKVCAGESGVVFSIEPIENATGYQWLLPEGASIEAGSNSPQIVVAFDSAAQSGYLAVRGTNPYGYGPYSAPFLVTVNQPTLIETQPVSPPPVYEGDGTAVFNVTASGTDLSYQWQEFITDWNNVSDNGLYSGALTNSLVITNPPLELNGRHYRCQVIGLCGQRVATDGAAFLTVQVITQTHAMAPSGEILPQCKIYPNPSKNFVHLNVELVNDARLVVYITDLAGRIVNLPGSFLGMKGTNNLRIETNMLLAGIYVVQMQLISTNINAVISARMIIQP